MKLAIVRTAIQQMYKKGHFSICTIESICDLCGISIPSETKAAFRLLHCIDFQDMEPETRQWLSHEIDRLFIDSNLLKSNWEPQITKSTLVLSGNVIPNISKKENK